MSKVAIGTMVHNEAGNLPLLLPRLAALRAAGHTVEQIIVVCSACTDSSADIAYRAQAKDSRVEVIVQKVREGKAAAINLFLARVRDDIEACVLISADVLPAPGSLAALLEPFCDPCVGMTGAQPVPTNPQVGILNRVVRFQWAVHHRVALRHPKLGEMVAFRASVPGIDPRTPVDEASLEALITSQGLALRYAAGATVRNCGPQTLSEYISQRTRIFNGHIRLRRQSGYEVSTYRVRSLLPPVLDELRDHPGEIPVAIAAVCLEAFARVLGTADQRILGRTPTVWQSLSSTKQPANWA